MKKILLGTTALVGAVALYSSAALAGSPTVTVSGYSDFQAGFADQDLDVGTAGRDTKFRNDNEIHIKAEGRSDNGLGYGAVVELEADVSAADDNEGVNADKTYLFLESAFGRVEMGANTDAAEALRVDASTFARATGGIDGDWYHFVNVGNFIYLPNLPTALAQGVTEDANKITYYSPRFSGLQLGVSYTPDQGDVGSAAGFSGDANGDQENAFNLGLNYAGQFNQVGVAASLTGEFGTSETSLTEDLAAWAAGANVSYAGFTVGASYGDWQESNQIVVGSNDDSNYWTLGAGYDFGPGGVSVTYLDSTFADTNDFTNVAIGADYQLAPGLVPYVEVSFFEQDAAGTAADNDGTVVLVGTELSF